MGRILQESSVDNIRRNVTSHTKIENAKNKHDRGAKNSTLVLKEFGPTPWIEFGAIRAGERCCHNLAVHNPSSVPATLTVENIPHNRGLGIEGVERSALEHFYLELCAGGTANITLIWEPAQRGTLRESIEWKCNGTYRLHTVLSAECSGEIDRFSHTHGVDLGQDKDENGMIRGKRRLSQADVLDAEASRLQEKRGRYLHAPEYIYSTEQDEESWGAFESAQFTNWLNFHLAPKTVVMATPNASPQHSSENAHTHTTTGYTSPQYRTSARPAPYVELDLIHAETVYTRELYNLAKQDGVYKEAKSCVSSLLANATMMFKPDTASCFDVHAPVDPMYTTTHTHLMQDVVELLCAVYSREWLCRALQVVVGRPVSAGKCLSKHFSATLGQYMRSYVQCVSCKPHQTPCRTLEKLLCIIFLLDRAGSRSKRVCGQTATVFRKKGQIKSTTGVLRLLANTLLYGQGDIIRQIRILGVEPSYMQTPLDEYGFIVDNTHTQLRDGVRLARLCESLFGTEDVLRQCQYPAETEKEKCDNVSIALEELCCHIPGLLNLPNCDTISASDIVKGHKEKTEALVWRLMFHCNARTEINTDDVECEIQRCIKDLRLQKGRHFTPAQPTSEADVTQSLLMQWCEVVAAHFDLKIEAGPSAADTFNDGRVLCALVAYYHPHLLPYSEIRQGSKGSRDSFPSSDVLHNFRLISSAISQLGGVAPVCLQGLTQNEEHMLSFVGHLCVRMMTLGRKAKAALRIQRRYRHYNLFSPSHAHARRMRRVNAVRRIERFWKQYTERKKNIRIKALRIIVRCLSARAQRTRHRIKQQNTLERLERERVENRVRACVKVQRWWGWCVRGGQLRRSREQRALKAQQAMEMKEKEKEKERLIKLERQRESDLQREREADRLRQTGETSEQSSRGTRVRFQAGKDDGAHTGVDVPNSRIKRTKLTNTLQGKTHTETHSTHTCTGSGGTSHNRSGVTRRDGSSYRRGYSESDTAARLQALWRGVCYRREMTECQKQLLKRVRASEKQAKQHPSRTLRSITDRAVGHLRKGGSSEKRLANLIKACQHLMTSTELSAACRVQLTENGGLQAMVRFMKGCDRTEAQQRALLLVLTLVNRLAENGDAAAALMESDQDVIVTLVDVIQNFRDSDAITLKASQVLLSLVNVNVAYLESMRTMEPIIARAQAVYTLAMRKEAMISRARLISHDADSATTTSEIPDHLQRLSTLLELLKAQ